MDGFCVDAGGGDVNSGVINLGQLSGDLLSQQSACWQVWGSCLANLICTDNEHICADKVVM
jgi:hypothetical protein